MEFKKMRNILLSIIAGLVLIYTASLVFSPELRGARSASFVWLDSKNADRITAIRIDSDFTPLEFFKKNNQWFVLRDNEEYPARNLRIEDFIAIFTTRSLWTVRSSSASFHERLGLDEENASRVRLFSENTTLLDVLLGGDDITGREIYIRKYGQNEVRSGDNLFSFYLRSPIESWFNLRLIPESEDSRITIDNVQRLIVHNLNESITFSRWNRGWVVSNAYGEAKDPDMGVVENYIRTILNTEGDDFAEQDVMEPHMFSHSHIIFEFGNGTSRTIWFTGPDETERRLARVDGSDYIYSIAPWAAARLFRNVSDFERQ